MGLPEKNKIDFKTQTEVRLLTAALLSEDYAVREAVFNSDYFTSNVGKSLFEKFAEVFVKNPDTDYSAYLSALPDDEQNKMLSIIKTASTQNIPDERIIPTLKMLKHITATEKFKSDMIDAVLSDNFTAEDIRTIIENSTVNSELTDSRQKYFDEYETKIEVIPTGYKKLDTMLNGGFAKGTLGALGARPSVGKTTMAINMAVHNCDLNVLFFSLEMTSRMIYDKIIADIGDIDYSFAVKHEVNFNTVKSILKRFDKLTVIDNLYAVEDMVDVIRQQKPDLVFVDYIQIVGTKKDFEVPRQRVDYISQLFKRTAKQLNCSIINLSQLTRDAKEEPTMSALKESGGLEQDSDYVILLKRPFVTNKSSKDVKPSDVVLKVDKNKFGNTGELEYFFDGQHQRFTEIGSEPIAHMKKGENNDGENDDLPF